MLASFIRYVNTGRLSAVFTMKDDRNTHACLTQLHARCNHWSVDHQEDVVAEKHLSAEQRREQIMEKLRMGDGMTQVENLSRFFGVSVATIRRDLDRLSQQERVTRTYGGAVIGNIRAEQSLREREVTHASAKDAIAREAAQMVHPGSTVLLDAGTTTGQLARYLAKIPGLTVITNGLNALNIFAEAETDVQAIALGGSLRRTNQALIGPIAELVVRSVYADIAFIGTDCVDVERGISSRTLEQNSLKGLMAAQARRCVVLADSSKLNANWSTFWAPLPDPCDLLTDASATDESLEPFQSAKHVNLVVCGSLNNASGELAG
jgi:DeoR/GlpR family transcriptional regulator of sugar metabolism